MPGLVWGQPGNLHYALTDLGRVGDYRALKRELAALGEIELLTITHIDADHIAGAVPLFDERPAPFTPRETWFNAYHQLGVANERLQAAERETLGPVQGEKVTAGLVKFRWRWNAAFASGVVSINSNEAKAPIILSGGLTVRLLSPSDKKLARLIPKWDEALAKAKMRTTDEEEVEQALAAGRERLGIAVALECGGACELPIQDRHDGTERFGHRLHRRI